MSEPARSGCPRNVSLDCPPKTAQGLLGDSDFLRDQWMQHRTVARAQISFLKLIPAEPRPTRAVCAPHK
jgi:hypothetical protein